MGDIYTNPPQSRNEAILRATIDGTEYEAPPQSRIEDLLVELKAAIEQGACTGSYNDLSNKPQINSVTLQGDQSISDLFDGKVDIGVGAVEESGYAELKDENGDRIFRAGSANGGAAIESGALIGQPGALVLYNGEGGLGSVRPKGGASLVEVDLPAENGTLALDSQIASSQTLAKASVVTVNDAAPINAEDITVDITPVQLGSGTPSPDNIRPIEGWTGAELTQKDAATNPTVTRIYTADFGETVYGGKWHVTEGGTDKTHANIASYNGETINEPWLSSMDEYSPGATPTTGAQVVYPLTTPTTISTPKQNVPMLQGINTVSADCGDVSLKYQPDNVIGELKGEIEGKLDTINNVGFHNSIYRGKSLGTSITTAQWNAISAGTFYDMYIGDYWTLSTTIGGTTSNVKYVIAGFDCWWNCGDSYPQSSNKHHIVLVPESSLYYTKMNDSDITTGGYVGSKMYTDYLANARTGISTLFGNHLYSVRRLFTNAVNTAGQATGWGWYTSSVDLMNETMVYGYPVWTTSGFEVGVDRTILPLFALNPTSASIRAAWWLRGVAASSDFALVGGNGSANYSRASGSFGVRPAFAIY